MHAHTFDRYAVLIIKMITGWFQGPPAAQEVQPIRGLALYLQFLDPPHKWIYIDLPAPLDLDPCDEGLSGIPISENQRIVL